jgi:DNA uptake protein ComE-like DNA-binding protein
MAVAGINLGDLVPVDQIDLTGIQPGSIVGAQRIAYRRPSLTPAAPSTAWHFTHAGGYTLTPVLGFFRQLGMTITPADPGNLGAGDTVTGVPPITSAGTYLTRPVQIANVDTAGPNKTYQQLSGAAASTYPLTGPPNHFPFGGFARNGDILQVPFFGAYTIRAPGDPRDTSVLEMNSLPMDAAFVDDQDAANDPAAADTGAVTEVREQLGRFCPVGNPQAAVGARGDYEPTPVPTAANYNAIRLLYRYQWAMDLFDHLTVESPSDDFTPDVDDEPADTRMAPAAPAKYPGTPVPAPTANQVQTVANANSLPPGSTEGKVPVEGLININTASPKVLAALPMVLDPATGAVDTNLNAALAQAIVDYRDGNAATTTDPNGPFRTIYDLYKVPLFYQRQLDVLTLGDPDDLAGDISPLGTGATGLDGVRFDFEERFLLLNRISNMITTRSDSYTVYLLVQGWQDAGTATPTLRTQRRLAFIVDRSRITPNSPQLSPIPVPNN